METFSALLAICAGNSQVSGDFPAQRSVTRSFDVFFDQHPNKRLSKQWWGWWFETPSCPLWRHRNDTSKYLFHIMGPARVFKEKVKSKHNMYRKTFKIRFTVVGAKIVDHSDVVGVGAAPTTSSSST